MSELILADFGMFCFLIAATFLLISIFNRKRKSKDYRKFLTDMYVSAKIRLLAKNDGLDIEAEGESFNGWNKQYRRKTESYKLDDAVEDDLMQKIEEPVKKK